MEEPDATRRLIVEKVLDSTWNIKPLNESGKGISKLIQNSVG